MFDFLIQLNRDFEKVWGKGTAIQANDDLDNYTTPGSYYSVDTNTTATLSHVPKWVTTGFRLDVINTTTNKWLIQRIYSHNAHQRVSVRLKQGDGAFLDWTYDVTNADFQSGNTSLGSCPANQITDFKITFPIPFSTTPKVIVCLRSSSTSEKYGLLTAYVANVTTTGFTFRVANTHTTDLTPGGSWYASI